MNKAMDMNTQAHAKHMLAIIPFEVGSRHLRIVTGASDPALKALYS